MHGHFDADELVARVRQLAGGETVLSPAVVGTVFEALRRTPGSPDEASGPASLTAREQEIMNLAAGEIVAALVGNPIVHAYLHVHT